MSFLISTAHAAPAAQPAGGMMMQFVMIAVFIGIFYFLIWRPQANRAKEHRAG